MPRFQVRSSVRATRSNQRSISKWNNKLIFLSPLPSSLSQNQSIHLKIIIKESPWLASAQRLEGKKENEFWSVCLGRLEHRPVTKRLQVRFPVRTHAWVAGLFPYPCVCVPGMHGRQPIAASLSHQYFSLPSLLLSLKINQYI